MAKRLTATPAIALLSTLQTGCSDVLTGPERTVPETTRSFAAAQTDIVHFSGTDPAGGVIVCTGEVATGERSFRGHTRTTINGNGVRANFHFQYVLELVGDSGRRYIGHGTTNESVNLGPGQDFHTRVHNRLIAQGESETDDFSFTQLVRLKILPDGTIQHDLVELSLECT